MKKISFLLTCLILLANSIKVSAQSKNDKDMEKLIQMCIDYKELQPYFHTDKIPSRIPLYILDNGKIPNSLKLKKFGEAVKFLDSKTTQKAFIEIKTLELKPNSAVIGLEYLVEGVVLELKFKKDKAWKIIDYTLFEV